MKVSKSNFTLSTMMIDAVVQPKTLIQKPIGEFPHLRFLSGEPHQWPDRETELHAQHHLAGDEQLVVLFSP